MKVLIIGYFGYITNQLDGQTVKTRNIYSLLKKNSTHIINYFDTQSFKKSKYNVAKLLMAISNADVIYYLPAQRNLKYIFPVIFSICKVLNIKLNYLVVGGWLQDFIKDNPLHKYLLLQVSRIYVETDTLYQGLNSLGFSNIYKLHNFRMEPYPQLNISTTIPKPNTRLVFMARVTPQKGVDLIFRLSNELKIANIQNVTIDIYGPISKDYTDNFYHQLKKSDVKYRGILEPENIHNTLKEYDLLLFPTKFYTEGFPGTVLDAYISGLPVITTNWLNAKEFVINGKSGYITPFNDEKAFINKVLYVLMNPNEISVLKKNTLVLRDKYSSHSAWEILRESINQ